MKLYNHSNPSKRDDDFGSFVERQLSMSMDNGKQMNNLLNELFKPKKKELILDSHEFILHPINYPDSKIIVYYFLNGIPFEDQEIDEDELKLKELWAFLKLEKYFETPYEATSRPDFNWHQYLELFLNWRGY